MKAVIEDRSRGIARNHFFILGVPRGESHGWTRHAKAMKNFFMEILRFYARGKSGGAAPEAREACTQGRGDRKQNSLQITQKCRGGARGAVEAQGQRNGLETRILKTESGYVQKVTIRRSPA